MRALDALIALLRELYTSLVIAVLRALTSADEVRV